MYNTLDTFDITASYFDISKTHNYIVALISIGILGLDLWLGLTHIVICT